MNKNVLVTGGFDPMHSGHIAYLKSAKLLGHILWVGLNSDSWLARKKGTVLYGCQRKVGNTLQSSSC